MYQMPLFTFWLFQDVFKGRNNVFFMHGFRINLNSIHSLCSFEFLFIIESHSFLPIVNHFPLCSSKVTCIATNKVLVPFRMIHPTLRDVEIVHKTHHFLLSWKNMAIVVFDVKIIDAIETQEYLLNFYHTKDLKSHWDWHLY